MVFGLMCFCFVSIELIWVEGPFLLGKLLFTSLVSQLSKWITHQVVIDIEALPLVDDVGKNCAWVT